MLAIASHLALIGCSSGSSSTHQNSAADLFEEELRGSSTNPVQPVQYEPVLVPGYQLPRLHVGNTIVGYGSEGTIFSYYHPSGTLYEAWKGYGVKTAPYWFDGDALCVRYRGSPAPACYFVVVENNQPYYASASTGQPITTFSYVGQGDVEGLTGAASRGQGTDLWAAAGVVVGGTVLACAFFLDCFGSGGSYAGDSGSGSAMGFDEERRKDEEEERRRRGVVRRPYGGSSAPAIGDLYDEPNWGAATPTTPE
jgi:hypothetical protein